MTVKSWTEYRLFKLDGEFFATIASAADAVQFAKEARVANKDPNLKFICQEVSVAEIPKKRFVV